jgi:putative transposase of IS4/5 family DUF4096
MATSSTTLTMAEQLVPDEVWAAIRPLLPSKRPHSKGGRPWIEDRAVLGGIIYVLRAGVPWRLLPARELGCGSPATCWRRLRDWQHAGVWEIAPLDATGIPLAGRPANSTPTKATSTRVAEGRCAAAGSPADRPRWHRIQPATRPSPVDGRTLAGLVAGQPAAHRPLRAPRRPTHGVSTPGLRVDLFPQTQVVVKRPLATSDRRHQVRVSSSGPGLCGKVRERRRKASGKQRAPHCPS